MPPMIAAPRLLTARARTAVDLSLHRCMRTARQATPAGADAALAMPLLLAAGVEAHALLGVTPS